MHPRFQRAVRAGCETGQRSTAPNPPRAEAAVTEHRGDGYREFAVGVLAADRCDPTSSAFRRDADPAHRRQSGRVSGRPDLPSRDAVAGHAAPLPGLGNVTTTFLADGNPCLADTGRAS
jgi:hypothetical protein